MPRSPLFNISAVDPTKFFSAVRDTLERLREGGAELEKKLSKIREDKIYKCILRAFRQWFQDMVQKEAFAQREPTVQSVFDYFSMRESVGNNS